MSVSAINKKNICLQLLFYISWINNLQILSEEVNLTQQQVSIEQNNYTPSVMEFKNFKKIRDGVSNRFNANFLSESTKYLQPMILIKLLSVSTLEYGIFTIIANYFDNQRNEIANIFNKSEHELPITKEYRFTVTNLHILKNKNNRDTENEFYSSDIVKKFNESIKTINNKYTVTYLNDDTAKITLEPSRFNFIIFVILIASLIFNVVIFLKKNSLLSVNEKFWQEKPLFKWLSNFFLFSFPMVLLVNIIINAFQKIQSDHLLFLYYDNNLPFIILLRIMGFISFTYLFLMDPLFLFKINSNTIGSKSEISGIENEYNHLRLLIIFYGGAYIYQLLFFGAKSLISSYLHNHDGSHDHHHGSHNDTNIFECISDQLVFILFMTIFTIIFSMVFYIYYGFIWYKNITMMISFFLFYTITTMLIKNGSKKDEFSSYVVFHFFFMFLQISFCLNFELIKKIIHDLRHKIIVIDL